MYESILTKACTYRDDEVCEYSSSDIMRNMVHIPTLCHGYAVADIPKGADEQIVNTLIRKTAKFGGIMPVAGYIIAEEDCEMPLAMLGMYVIHKALDASFETPWVADTAWPDILAACRRYYSDAVDVILNRAKELNVSIPSIGVSLVH